MATPCPLCVAVLTCKIEELGSELKEHYKIEGFTPLLVPAQVRVMDASSIISDIGLERWLSC